MGEQGRVLLWACMVGLMGGMACNGFREAIEAGSEWFLTRSPEGWEYAALQLSLWKRWGIPSLGGAAAGLVLYGGMRLKQTQGRADFMEALVLGQGRMGFGSVMLRCVSSWISIVTGVSIGREGAMVQLSAMLASRLGQTFRMPTSQLRLLVACGVAAGIASAYKAPLAGTLFVAEVVLGTLAMQSLGPLVCSAVAATLVSRSMTSSAPLYASPSASHMTLAAPSHLAPSHLALCHLGCCVMLGALAGVSGSFFLRLLRISQRVFARLCGPICLRLALGGTLVGGIVMCRPEVWGNGYGLIAALLHDSTHRRVGLVLMILVWKLGAIAITVGSGAVGGVLTPTLYMGATLGWLFGNICCLLWPAMGGDLGTYVKVGMGCFLTATTHAPFMAILLLFEVTQDYDTMLPLMAACVSAYYLSHGIDKNSVYTAHIKTPSHPV